MRHILMAIPAEYAVRRVRGHVHLVDRQGHIHDLVGMAAHAVLLNHIDARILYFDHLRFDSQGKNGCMAGAIHGLEIVGPDDIVVWHMTIVAGGHPGMTASGPGDVLRGHDMAIDTRTGVI